MTTTADEGMWLVNQPPRQHLKARHGFSITDAWLEHVQKASVRFNSGGSGSFVSEDGLVLSNHHVGADALQKFGDKDHDYLKNGFYARALSEEKRCLDLELNVLLGIEDVTSRVNAAIKPAMSGEEAFLARRAVIAQIEKESYDKTGLRSDVITLYQGAQYHLYRFKKYTDVRLVFAPEQQIAFFGGDPDNFEYPRYDLDICLFRVYENGKPVKAEHYFKWSQAGVAEKELIFVPGHPGRTSRLLTLAELEYMRDVRLPFALERAHRLEVLLRNFSARSRENARRAKDDLFGIQNSRKALTGRLDGLLDPGLLEQKRAAEKRLREAADATPALRDIAGAWDKIATAQKVVSENALRHGLIEGRAGFSGDLFGIARTLLRASEELPKPNADRLREFGEAGLASLKFQLFSEKPIYNDLDQLLLADSITFLAGKLGYSDPLVQKVLAGKSPQDRAAELVANTRLKDVALRKKLYREGLNAVNAAGDPMIEFARIIDAEARALRKIFETQDEIKQQAHARIARVRFAIDGATAYPDATSTLRLSYGIVAGYEENKMVVPYQTTLAGLFQRGQEHENEPPFDIPSLWLKRKSRLNLSTPLNFVSTADIVGGNSGSPVINRQAEFVGIIFDGNIQSLVLDFAYSDKQARAVSVCSQSIIEALRNVYDAKPLADELIGKRRSGPSR